MRKFKIFIFSIFFLGLFFAFTPRVFPENNQFQDFSKFSSDDIVIIFNSGGWGDTPFEKADDFAPIVKGIQETLNSWGYQSVIVSYQRTKKNFLGRITGIKEFFLSFPKESRELGSQIERFIIQNPQKMVIIAGLSNGAAFVDETMEKISDNIKDRVFAIEVGIPFWKKRLRSNNILRLDNQGRDSLSEGRIEKLVFAFLKTPFKWIEARLKGVPLRVSRAIKMPGHEYQWNNLSPEISSFLKNKINNI